MQGWILREVASGRRAGRGVWDSTGHAALGNRCPEPAIAQWYVSPSSGSFSGPVRYANVPGGQCSQGCGKKLGCRGITPETPLFASPSEKSARAVVWPLAGPLSAAVGTYCG